MGKRRKYNWTEIQKDHDAGLTWRQLTDKHGVTNAAIAKAKKRGDLVTKSRSQAQKRSPHINRKLSQETKDKISKARIEYLRKNPDKVPYKLNHYSKGRSYPEQYFYDWLVKEGISFEEQKQVSVYQLDFVIGNIDLEIDGEQHYVDMRVVKSDERRNKYLTENGYNVIRVRWSDYQRLSKEDKALYLNELKKLFPGSSTGRVGDC